MGSEFNGFTIICTIISVIASAVTSYFVSRWITKQNNTHYFQDHENENAQKVLSQAPCIRVETFEQFQLNSNCDRVFLSQLDVSDTEEIAEPPRRRKKEFHFSEKHMTDKMPDMVKRWVAITIINKSNFGFQITSVSTTDDADVPISNSGGNLVNPKQTIAYLFPYRDSPENIHAKFRSLPLSYKFSTESGYINPQIDPADGR